MFREEVRPSARLQAQSDVATDIGQTDHNTMSAPALLALKPEERMNLHIKNGRPERALEIAAKLLGEGGLQDVSYQAVLAVVQKGLEDIRYSGNKLEASQWQNVFAPYLTAEAPPAPAPVLGALKPPAPPF